jgi:Serine dehydrogenase proteinase
MYPNGRLGGILADTAGVKRIDAFWRTISKLETKRKSRIFCIIHCGEDDDHICGPTFANVLAERAKIKNLQTLELLLHSPGGHADIAYQVVRFFRRHCQRFNVIIPLMAKSAATLMCLGANSIYMGELAELGPIDVQIQDPLEKGAKTISPLDEFKSAEFLRDYAIEVLDFFTALIVRRSGMSVKEALHESVPFTTGIMRPLYEQLDPLEIGEYKRSLAVGEHYADRLLSHTRNPRHKEIVETLVSKYPSHQFAIDPAEARALGLPVHILPPNEENAILGALESIIDNGDTLYGFPKAPPKPTTARSSRREAVRTQEPKPIAVAR